MTRARWFGLALAIGFCAAAADAQQSRSRSGAREITLPVILSIEDDRASTRADLDVLLGALRGQLAPVATRTLGRLERRDVIADLLPFLAAKEPRNAAATALGLALRGPALDGVLQGQQERAVLEALLASGDSQLPVSEPIGLDSIARTLGRLPHGDVESFRSAETFLRKVLEKPFPQIQDAPHIAAARGLESLARLRRKIASLEDETVARLRIVARLLDPRRAESDPLFVEALNRRTRIVLRSTVRPYQVIPGRRPHRPRPDPSPESDLRRVVLNRIFTGW